MSEGIKNKRTELDLQNQPHISANLFSLFNNSTLGPKPKIKRVEEDENAIREYEDDVLIRETPKPKPPPPPPKSPPRNNANSKLFASRESLEKTAINMSSGSLTPNQIELLPEGVRNFVFLNPGFIRDLMKDNGVIAQHLLLLNDSELMQL